jgi:hypothetical protein
VNKMPVFQKGFSLSLAYVALGVVLPQAELVREPTHVGTNIDIGQLVTGIVYDGPQAPQDTTKRQTITRTGVYLTESGTYNDRLTVKLSIGGLFWYALPETKEFQERRIQFGPGVGQAQGLYAFGEDPKSPVATLQFGLFSHKYSESINLGEYLYRSGTYPGTIVTGGWSYLNSASYMAQGLRLMVPTFDGLLTHDLNLYMERGLQPAHDLTPGYMLTMKTNAFKFGAGIVWSHAISLNSKRLAPKVDDNAYNKVTKLPVKGEQGEPTPDSLKAYYTFKGFKTNAYGSIDIGSFIGNDNIKPGQFSLYGEVALLGVENQPYFYENRAYRRPILLGINIPTFGVFDRLCFEYEHLQSAFPNSNAPTLLQQIPVPVEEPYSYKPDSIAFKEPKWSLYAKRKVVDGVSVHFQAASDHLRHFNRGAAPGALPATQFANHWYYIFRLEFGI